MNSVQVRKVMEPYLNEDQRAIEWNRRVAAFRPWIVYYPPGEFVQAAWFLALLEHYGESVASIISYRMAFYNSELDPRESHWAFGRMDSADFTHVLTRGHYNTLRIEHFKIGKVL